MQELHIAQCANLDGTGHKRKQGTVEPKAFKAGFKVCQELFL